MSKETKKSGEELTTSHFFGKIVEKFKGVFLAWVNSKLWITH